MPTVYEKYLTDSFSRSLTDKRVKKEYYVRDAAEQDVAEAAVLAASPAYLGPLVRKSIDGRRESGADWTVEVEYGPGDRSEAVGATGADAVEPPQFDAQEPLDFSWAFDTNSQSVHITQAKETLYRRVPADSQAVAAGGIAAGAGVGKPGSGPNEALAIGLTKDRVEGCDIHVPALRFSRTITRPTVNLAYLNQALYGLVGKTNRERFFVFEPGEVLYLGASGNFVDATSKGWTVTHNFACSPNEKNLKFGSGKTDETITLPFKGGWEYVWVLYRWKEVAFPAPDLIGGGPAVTEKILMQVPAAVYCQKVYDSGDFNLLGIGGASSPEGKAQVKRAAGGKWVAQWGQPGGGNPVINNTGGGEGEFDGGGDF